MTEEGQALAPASELSGLLDAVVAVGAGLELNQTLQRIVQAAVDLVDASYGALGVLGPDRRISEFVVTGIPDEVVQILGPPPEGQGVLGLLSDDPRPLRIADLQEHPEAVGLPPGHPPMHSFVGVPIRVRGEVFGNLYLTEKRGAPAFSEHDEQVLTALAAAAGVAIENARMFSQTQTRAAWMRASAEILAAVLRGEEPDEVLDLVAERALSVADVDAATIALPDGVDELVIEHVAGPDTETLLGRSVSLSDASGDSPEPSVYTDRYGPTMQVPLVSGDRTLGTLVLAKVHGAPPFRAEERTLAETFAGQAALALVLAEAQREQERLAVLEDRDRIGRDLHDLVIQRLFATGMMLQGASRTAKQPDVVERIERAVHELDATILEVRSTIFALHESRGEPTGLRGRVLRELTAASHTLGFEPTVRFDGPIDSVVPDDVAEHVVAAVREALSNVARHAAASVVRVSLSVDDTDVVLIVTDNGVGLAAAAQRRSGLANLAKRAEGLGGSCITESASATGSGTRLVWRAPVR
ncbi:MAG: GAF domain-containing protein [Actinomycetes bacterium]